VTEIEEVYLEELDFAMKKINDRTLYSHTEGTYGGLPDLTIIQTEEDANSKVTSDYQRSEGSSTEDQIKSIDKGTKFKAIQKQRRRS